MLERAPCREYSIGHNHISPSGSALPKTKFESASLDMHLTGLIDL
jgi:hypothetical protein